MVFKGYEIVPDRVHEGQRIFQKWDLKNCSLVQQDLSVYDFEIPTADCYFIYDFGTKTAVTSILNKLKRQSQSRSITVVGRGRGIRHWIAMEHPWLGYVVPPVHHEHWSLYRS